VVRSPLIWAMITLCAAFNLAGAQVTAPLTREFRHNKFHYWNESGNLLVSATLQNNRLDTLPEMRIRAVVLDTLGDSSQVILSVSSWTANRAAHETDTVLIHTQLWLPCKGPGGTGRVPDSTFSLILRNSKPPEKSEAFRIWVEPVGEDEGFVQLIPFANDTLKGTGNDTSEVINLGRGAKEAVFGYKPDGTTAAVYELLYNSGFGWGLAGPSDTLADSAWTAETQAGSWRFRDVGELLDAELLRVIRRGKSAADTVRVQQTLRTRPR